MLDRSTDLIPQAYLYTRISTPEQGEGDGLRRQKSGGEKVAEELGLPLNTTLSLEDFGRSAFTGDNRTSGALSGFLELAKDGKIAVGSVLIMDALDRFSREDWTESVEPYIQLLKTGVDIFTLADKRRHSRKLRGMEGMMQLMMSLMQLGIGHEESFKKSYRISETWVEKRRKAADEGTPMTSITPGWIRLDKETGKFVPIPDRVEVLIEIFTLAAQGVGKRTIAKRFAHIETWGRGKRAGRTFYESYVHKLLCDRRVLGEFQPGTKPKGGVWTASGDPIPDFYPRVISDKLWWKVRYARDKNKGIGGPGNPDAFRSLFRGLTFCGCCTSKFGKPVGMAFVSKGKTTRGGHDKLVCGQAVRSHNVEKRKKDKQPVCTHVRRYNYADLERAVLFGFGNAARDLLGHENERRGELEKAADVIDSRIAGLKKQQKKWLDAMEGDAAAPKAVMSKLASIEADLVAAEHELQAKLVELNATPARQGVGSRLSELMTALKQRESVEDRRRLNEQLRRHIKSIVFVPHQDGTATVTTTFKDGKTAKSFLPQEDAPDPVETALLKRLPRWPKTGDIADDEHTIAQRLERRRGTLRIRRLNAGWRAGRLA